MTSKLTEEQLEDLRRHYAEDWVETVASEAFSEHVRAIFQKLEQAALQLKLRDVIDREAIATAIQTVCQEAEIRAIQELSQALFDETLRRSQKWNTSADSYLKEDTQEALLALAADPQLVQPALIRSLVQNPALESMTRQMLQETLVEFNEKVNPFFADWGLPKLLDAVPLFGKGTLRRAFDAMRRDFDSRLEPEMGKFVEGFARRALTSTVDRMIERAAEPEMVELRQHAVRSLLSQQLSDFGWAPDASPSQRAREAVALVVQDVIRNPLTHEQVLAAVDEELGTHADATLEQWLRSRGVAPISAELIVSVAWPAVRSLLLDATTRSELDAMIQQSHARYLTKQCDD